ncbi:MAG: hypothetical protein ACI353_04645 [Alloprevotella sp.]
MKKWYLLLLLAVLAIGANAQFKKGTKFVGASLTGLNLSYSSNEKFRLGLNADAGYFVADCLMLRANVGYEHTRNLDDVAIGAGARYFFRQNGIYLGAGAEYNHFTKSNNDVMIPVEVGYAFYLNHYLTIEPAVYYKMSLHDFSGNSTVGLRVGFGFYF